MKKHLIATFSAAMLGLTVSPTHAAVIVSNLDQAEFLPSGPVKTAHDVGQAVALGGTSYTLTSVTVPQPTNQLSDEQLVVYSRNADGTLGVPLFSDFALTYDGIQKETYAPVGTIEFTLQANTSYFFVLVSTDANNVVWNFTHDTSFSSAGGANLPASDTSFTSDGVHAPVYSSLADGPQIIQVNGAAVPEPSSLVLIGLAAAGGAVALKRRRTVA